MSSDARDLDFSIQNRAAAGMKASAKAKSGRGILMHSGLSERTGVYERPPVGFHLVARACPVRPLSSHTMARQLVANPKEDHSLRPFIVFRLPPSVGHSGDILR